MTAAREIEMQYEHFCVMRRWDAGIGGSWLQYVCHAKLIQKVCFDPHLVGHLKPLVSSESFHLSIRCADVFLCTLNNSYVKVHDT